MSPWPLLAWAVVWVTVGAGVAILLVRQGQPTELAWMAVVGWPLAAAMLRPVPRAGPHAGRVERALRRFEESLVEQGVVVPADLGGVRERLLRVDARLARVDRMLADADDLSPDDVAVLREARARAEAGVLAVLDALAHLRVRAGLAALAADAAPLAEPLAELGARVRALDEVSGLLGVTGRP